MSGCQKIIFLLFAIQLKSVFGQLNGDVRLRGGTNPYEGRVEVYYYYYYYGEWATVCDNSWDSLDGAVVCRQLGYGSVIATRSSAYYGAGIGYVVLDDVSCYGYESRLEDCPQSDWFDNDCSHAEDAGVQCSGTRGSNSGGSNSGGSNSGDSNSGGSNSGDSNSGGSNSENSNSGGSNSGGFNSRGSNSGDSSVLEVAIISTAIALFVALFVVCSVCIWKGRRMNTQAAHNVAIISGASNLAVAPTNPPHHLPPDVGLQAPNPGALPPSYMSCITPGDVNNVALNQAPANQAHGCVPQLTQPYPPFVNQDQSNLAYPVPAQIQMAPYPPPQ